MIIGYNRIHLRYTPLTKETLLFYAMSTGCPNRFGIGTNMFTSEASNVYKKVCISLQKNTFLAFFENCKIENGF